MALDTTSPSQDRHDEVLRAMTPEQRVAVAVEMSEAVRRSKRSARPQAYEPAGASALATAR